MISFRRTWAVAACTLALVGCDRCSKTSSSEAADGAASTTASANTDGGANAAVRATDGAAEASETDDAGSVNTLTISSDVVAAAVNPSKLPAYHGPTGSVEGTITVTGDPAPVVTADFKKCPGAQNIWGRAFREGAPLADGKSRPLEGAVVVVTGYEGFFLPETKPAVTATIEGCGFTQRTLTLTFGQRIDVLNRSNDYWTPYLEPGSKQVMRMATPHGDAVPLYPNKPGRWAILDHDRSYASVDAYVFLHPLHASTDLTGHYRIDGLPVGKVQIGAAHPQFSASATSELEVEANVVHKVDLSLSFDAKAWAATNATKPVPTIR